MTNKLLPQKLLCGNFNCTSLLKHWQKYRRRTPKTSSTIRQHTATEIELTRLVVALLKLFTLEFQVTNWSNFRRYIANKFLAQRLAARQPFDFACVPFKLTETIKTGVKTAISARLKCRLAVIIDYLLLVTWVIMSNYKVCAATAPSTRPCSLSQRNIETIQHYQ